MGTYTYTPSTIPAGATFGRLTVLERYPDARPKYRCRCACGEETIVDGDNLAYDHTKSCGCLRRELAIALGKSRRKHGMWRARLYETWRAMRRRCTDPRLPNYPNYGGRGITVCHEWQAFEAFRDWALANGYQDDLEIDRIDNDGNYCPENCRWATRSEQERNKRTSSKITAFGETKCFVEWAEDSRCVVNVDVLRSRIRQLGWEPERALTTPSTR